MKVLDVVLLGLLLLSYGCSGVEDESAEQEQLKRVFITRSKYEGDLAGAGEGKGGLESADNLCQRSADSAILGGRWIAWLSNSKIDAIDRIKTEGPWYYVTKKELAPVIRRQVAFHNKETFRTIPLVIHGTNELGDPDAGDYWTGTRHGGRASKENCGDWSTADSTAKGQIGSTFLDSKHWTEWAVVSCSERHQLLCIELEE